MRCSQIFPTMIILAIFLTFSTVALYAADQQQSERPNILWITAEDISPHLGCYGDDYAVTPQLDRLAEQGVRYTRAFASASVCTPARSCLITGIFASSLGTQHLRGAQPLPQGVRCFTEYIRQAGYYCSNNSKEDYNFPTPAAAWDESSRTAHWRKRPDGKPFFSVFNITVTHQSQVRYSREKFDEINAALPPAMRRDPTKVPLPPYYPDTPIVRRIQAQLHMQITKLDQQVGQLLEQLEADGLADDTIVFFYSDHGNGLPRHKRWLHDSGIRVPLIVRFPKKYAHLAPGKPGSTVDRLVSFVDFAPTVLSLLDLEIPDYMQGSAFLGKKTGKPRQYVFAIRDRVDEVYECSRTVRDERYHYIRNYMPHRARMQHSDYSERTPIRQEVRRLAAQGELSGDVAWLAAETKPAEELYDTQADPHEMRNLVDSPEHDDILERMRGALRRWVISTLDTGMLAEVEMCRRAADSPYKMARREGIYDIARILDAAELVGRGPTKRGKLTGLLEDTDPGVRYWAATGLLALGTEAADSTAALRKALKDDSPNVRLVAAEAMCRLGHDKEALPVIVAALESDDERLVLQAAITLAAIGERSRPALPQMKEAIRLSGKGYYGLYVRWALARVLKELEAE